MEALRNLIEVYPAGEAELLSVSDTVESTDLPVLGPVRGWRVLAVRSAAGCRIWLCGSDRAGRDVLERVSIVDALKGVVLTSVGGFLLDGWPGRDLDVAAVRHRIIERSEEELAEAA